MADFYKRFFAKDVFKNVYDENGKYELNPQSQLLGFSDKENPAVPAANENYCFRKDILSDVLSFLMRPNGDALYISGPTWSGKTSVVTETAARLNWPVQQLTLNSRFEFSQLKGQFTVASLKEGGPAEMHFMHGPLATAMKYGHILLLNEIDLADPGELSGLNDVLEGRPLVIAENRGEIIKPHPMFRVVVTGNSFGSGDATGLYQGVLEQNVAALDRYRFLYVGYPDEAVETALLEKEMPSTTPEVRKLMIRLAHEIRTLFLGEDGNGTGTLSATMSTRCLVRWARLSRDLRYEKHPLKEALKRALLLRLEPAEAASINNLAIAIFGEVWMDEPTSKKKSSSSKKAE